MTDDEINEQIQDRIFELRYWQQISEDLGGIGDHIREIGRETAEQIESHPLDFLGAGDLIKFILEHTEEIGKLTLGLQDLVSGRLTAIEGKMDADG